MTSVVRRNRILVLGRLPGYSEAIALSARNLAQKTVCLLSDSSFVTCPETRKRGGVGGDCWVSSVPFGVTLYMTYVLSTTGLCALRRLVFQ